MNKLFCVIGLLLSASIWGAPMYEWVDENGVKHFSQQPPEHMLDLQPRTINGVPPVSSQSPGSEDQQPIEISNTSEQPSLDGTEHIEVPAKDAELCAQARSYIQRLSEPRRIRIPDEETGELRYLDDNDKATQLNYWKERADVYCG